MNYTTRRNISLIVSLILLIGALVVFFTLDWPIFSQIRQINKKIAQEQVQYDEQAKAVQTAKSIVAQYNGLKAVSNTISLSVPRGTEIENVIAQLNNLASQSGLEVQGINFETPSLPTLKDKKAATNIAKENRILRLTLSLSGSYESFKTLISSIESNIRLMDVKTISFSSAGGEGQGGNRFNFKVGIDAYYQ